MVFVAHHSGSGNCGFHSIICITKVEQKNE
nr:MAG TPA: OTU-like cysteine protease [Caudoviricetes sp.]DAM29394.1 MAG TPA: OTU-like cysteine protease [Caudoviricetes sp.]